MTEATPSQPTQPAETATPPTPAAPTAPPAAETGGFKSEESKQAVLADLAKERDARQALAEQIEAIKAETAQRNQALAQALGLAETPKSENDLAETVKSIQQALADQQLKATRLEVAAEHQIPAEYHDLLTETDTEKLKAQAAKIASLVAAQKAAAGTPAHLPIPGQGAGGNASPEAEAEALYRQFYPNSNR